MGISLTDGDQHVNVDHPVFESGSDIPAVVIVGQGGMVLRKALFHLRALDGVQKTCAEWKSSINARGWIKNGWLTDVSGLSWIRNLAKKATRIIASASKMKIHARLGLPPMPPIIEIRRPRRPPKEASSVAAEKKMAIWRLHSYLRYQRVM